VAKTTTLSTDARDFLVGPDGDIVVTTDFVFSRGVPAVVQSCRIKLMMFAGEWFLNLDAGIPYWQEILAKKPAVAIAAAKVAFREALESVDGVDKVLQLSVTFAAVRTLNISWQVRTAFGDSTVQSTDVTAGGAQ
jgi:hypothetical protein